MRRDLASRENNNKILLLPTISPFAFALLFSSSSKKKKGKKEKQKVVVVRIILKKSTAKRSTLCALTIEVFFSRTNKVHRHACIRHKRLIRARLPGLD